MTCYFFRESKPYLVL